LDKKLGFQYSDKFSIRQMREEIMAIMKTNNKKGQYSQHLKGLNMNDSFAINDLLSQRSNIGNQQTTSPEINVDILQND